MFEPAVKPVSKYVTDETVAVDMAPTLAEFASAAATVVAPETAQPTKL